MKHVEHLGALDRKRGIAMNYRTLDRTSKGYRTEIELNHPVHFLETSKDVMKKVRMKPKTRPREAPCWGHVWKRWGWDRKAWYFRCWFCGSVAVKRRGTPIINATPTEDRV